MIQARGIKVFRESDFISNKLNRRVRGEGLRKQFPEEQNELPGDRSDGGPFKKGTGNQENTPVKEKDA